MLRENKESGPKGPDLKVSGVPPEADQVSGKKKKLTPETSVFVMWDFYASNTPNQLAIFAGKAIELLPGVKDQVFDAELTS